MTNRRAFLSTSAAAGLFSVGISRGFGTAGAAPKQTLAPAAALDALMAGNNRFVTGTPKYADHRSRRDAVAAGQAPYAIVLSCSDSRVPPEIVFDQGLGDLFIVRVAGNYAEGGGIGSMQYSIDHFGSALLMVLGHSNCGAVRATVDNLKAGSPPAPGNIQDIVRAIAPAARAELHKPGDVYANAAEENVRLNVAKLKNTETIIAPAIEAGKLRIVGGIYDLKTGRVKLLPLT
ncbi:MAG: carbonic anhydrase [Candidatus Baltobacteraceae bacterium]